MNTEEKKSQETPLEDCEIASLMKTLASNSYKKSQSFPVKSQEPFKVIPLKEIAAQIAGDKAKEETKDIEVVDAVGDDLTAQVMDKEDSKNIHDKIHLEEQLEQPPKQVNSEEFSSQIAGENHEMAPSEADNSTSVDIQKTEEPANPDQTYAPAINNSTGVNISEKLYTEEEKNQAFQTGLLEGKANLEETKIKETDILINSLKIILEGLEKKIVIDTDRLENWIRKQIITISSERVGVEINEVPEVLVSKIKSMLKTVELRSNSRVLRMNQSDFQILHSTLKVLPVLKNFQILSDEVLDRGDLVFEIGGVSLEDRMGKRYRVAKSAPINTANLDHIESHNDNDNDNDNDNAEILSHSGEIKLQPQENQVTDTANILTKINENNSEAKEESLEQGINDEVKAAEEKPDIKEDAIKAKSEEEKNDSS